MSKEVKAYALDLSTDELYEYINNSIEEKMLSDLMNRPEVQTGLYGINPDSQFPVQHLLYDTPEHRTAAHKVLSKHFKTVAFNLQIAYIPEEYARHML